ncbi:MAG: hypothetical protein KME07_13720 [Pegethrix bostrychoides GSE-TBD4-15B]|jgi:hypothetical protein|uniref:Uncharacterized protein n=1 Tax=Pegethrix bostrychoides GSE-TBD4-15B TaxID=2839662 RepID=A0A951PBM7_9CYAN|nr:hypothetical protein [Pegethrix bostrychoides GSE-TBD4-15B]
MISRRWQSGTALSLTFAVTASLLLPIGLSRSVSAQVFPPSWRNGTSRPVPGYPSRSILPTGTVIPTRYEKEKIVVTPAETSKVTLTVDDDIRSASGAIIIPFNSEIEGELRPNGDGTQFVAQELVLSNGDRYAIEASSDVITRRETVSKRSNPEWFQGVAIGAVAAAVLGEVFGKIQLWQVLGGAGVGALGSLLIRNRNEVEVIVVDPATDLDLQLDQDFLRNPNAI